MTSFPSRHFLLRRPLFLDRNRTVSTIETNTDDKEASEDRINAASQRRQNHRYIVEERRVWNAIGKIQCVESIMFCIDLQEMTDHTYEYEKRERDTKSVLYTWCICKRTLRAIVRLASPRTIVRA